MHSDRRYQTAGQAVRHGESPADIVVGQHVVSTEIPVDGRDFVSFLLVGGNAAHAQRGDFKRALFDEFHRLAVENFQLGWRSNDGVFAVVDL